LSDQQVLAGVLAREADLSEKSRDEIVGRLDAIEKTQNSIFGM
jgi:hypothetical protein